MDQLPIRNELYGRGNETNAMLESFDRICSGGGEVLFLSGPSGVGKTALAHSLQGPVLDKNGFFISGMFDQYHLYVPLSAFRQAFEELCRELQSGNRQRRLRFKADVLLAIGNRGQVLVDLIPEFEAFLGLQPPLQPLEPRESRHRIAAVFQDFLRVICRPEHPLVVVMDDWQWADAASVELLRRLQIGSVLRYLLVIVSCRDDEADSGHPLASLVKDLRSHAVPVEVLEVKNIGLDDVRKMVTETLKPVVGGADELAAILHDRSHGNPLFVRALLNFLYESKQMRFDEARNCWRWTIDRDGGADLPENVAELFRRKLRLLDRDSRDLFSLAACLGNRFDLATLSLVSGRKPSE